MPRQRLESFHFLQGERDVPTIADDVNEKRFGQVGFHPRDVQDIIGIVHRIAMRFLTAGDLIHDDANKISAGSALLEDPGVDLFRHQAGPAETFAAEPGLHHFPAVFQLVEFAEYRDEHLVDGQVPAVNSKTSR